MFKVKERDLRRNDLDPSDILSTFSVGGSVETIMSAGGAVVAVVVGVLDVAVVEVVGVVELVSSFHVSLPKIN